VHLVGYLKRKEPTYLIRHKFWQTDSVPSNGSAPDKVQLSVCVFFQLCEVNSLF